MENPKNKEIVATLKEKFPKFHKGLLSAARNSDYGVVLSPSAVRTLREIYPDFKIDSKAVFTSLTQTHKWDSRKKSHRLTVRLDDENYKKFEAALKSASTATTQEFLEKVLEEYYEHQ